MGTHRVFVSALGHSPFLSIAVMFCCNFLGTELFGLRLSLEYVVHTEREKEDDVAYQSCPECHPHVVGNATDDWYRAQGLESFSHPCGASRMGETYQGPRP